MSHGGNPYTSPANEAVYASSAAVAHAGESERTTFIRKTYAHLFASIAAFIGIEFIFFNVIPAQTLMALMSPGIVIAMIVGFIIVSMVAHSWAARTASPTAQYLALSTYVLLQSIVFVPILAFCLYGPLTNGLEVIKSAALMTGVIFGGLTSVVFLTKSDFSGLSKYLTLGLFASLALILGGFLFGFHLGTWFSVFMIVLMAGYILYETSAILHHFRPDQHVAASLALFSSVTTLFFYILRLAIELQGE